MSEKFDPRQNSSLQTPAQENSPIPLQQPLSRLSPPPLQLKPDSKQQNPEEETTETTGHPLQADFENLADPPEENNDNNTPPLQRNEDGSGEDGDSEEEPETPGPFRLEVPSLSYHPWAGNQSRFSLGVDLNLDTGFDFRLSFRQYMEQQLSLPRIRTDLLRVDPNEFFRPIYDPLTSDKKPWELAPGPDPPQEASLGLLWSAIKTTPAVSRILNDVEQQASDAWSGLETGQQVLVGSSMVLVGGAALAGMYINPDTRGLINGVPLPVPGVSGLALELYIPEDNSSFFIGAHLDLGQFLPKSWGFGSASDPMLLPPQLRYRAATWPNSLSESLMRKADGTAGAKGNALPERATQPLPFTLQAKASEAFGADLSQVRMHPNAESAKAVQAKAYTQGSNVYFAPGQYNPNSRSGQELIGHELGHVVQQQQSTVQPTNSIKGLPLNDDAGLEREADVMGRQFAKAEGRDGVGGTPVQAKKTAVISRAETREQAMANTDLQALVQDYRRRLRRDRERVGEAYRIFEELKVMQTAKPEQFQRFMEHHSAIFDEIMTYLPAEYLNQADFGFMAGLTPDDFDTLLGTLDRPETWNPQQAATLEMLLATALQFAVSARMTAPNAEQQLLQLVQRHFQANPTEPIRAALERSGLSVPADSQSAISVQPNASEAVLTQSRGWAGLVRPFRQTLRESNQSGFDNRRTLLGEGLEILSGEGEIEGLSLATFQNASGMPGHYYGVQFTEGEAAGRVNVSINRREKILEITSDTLPIDSIDYATGESTVRTGNGVVNGLHLKIHYTELPDDAEAIQLERLTLEATSFELNAIRYLTQETTFGIGKIAATNVILEQETALSNEDFFGNLPAAFYQLMNITMDRIPQLTHQFMPDEPRESPAPFLQADIEELSRPTTFSLDFAQLNIEGLYYSGIGTLGSLNISGFNDDDAPESADRDVITVETQLDPNDPNAQERQNLEAQIRARKEELEHAEAVYYRRARRRLRQERRRLQNARQEVVRLRNLIEALEAQLSRIAPTVDIQVDTGRVEYIPSASLLEEYVTQKLEGFGLHGISYTGNIVLTNGLQLNSALSTHGNTNTNIHLRGLELPAIQVERVDLHAGGYHIQSAGVQLENTAISALLQLNDTTRARPGEEYGQILSGIAIREACLGLFKTNYLTVTKDGETVHLIDTGQIILSNLNLTNLNIGLNNLSPTVDAGQLGITADAILVQNLSAAGVDLAEGWFWLAALEMQTEAPVMDEANRRRSTTRIFTTRSATDEEVTVPGDPAQVLNAADVHHNIKVNNLRVTDTVHESLNEQNEATGTTSRDIGIELDIAHIDIDKLDLALPGQMSLCTEQDVLVSNINLKATYHLNVLDPETGTPGTNHQLELTSLEVGHIHIGQGTLEVFDGEQLHEVVTNGSVDLYGLYARNVLMNMALQEDGSRSAELMSGQFGLGSMNIRQVVYNALNIQRFSTGAISVQRVGNPGDGYYTFSANQVQGQATYDEDGNTARVQIGNREEGGASFSGRYTDDGDLDLSTINVPYFKLDRLNWTSADGVQLIATDGVRLHNTTGSLKVKMRRNAAGEQEVQHIRVPSLNIRLLESSALQVKFGSLDLDVGAGTYIEDVEVRDFYIPINEEGELSGNIDTGALNVNDLVLTMSDPGLVFRTDIAAEGLHFKAADGAIDVTADNPLFSGTNFQYGEHGDGLFVHLGLTSALPLIDPESIQMSLVPSDDGQLFYLTMVRPRLNSVPLQVKTINAAGIETSIITSLNGRIDQNVVVEYFPNSEGGHLLNVVTDKITLNGVDVQVDVSENTDTDFSFINYIEDALLSNHGSSHNTINLMLFGEAHELRTIEHSSGVPEREDPSGRTVPRNTELGINVQDLFEKVSPTFEENLDDLMDELIGTDTGADTIRSLLERAEFRKNEGNYSLMLVFRFFGLEAFDFEAYELIDAAHTFEQDGETWVKFKELLLNFVPDPEEVAAEEESFFDTLRSYADAIDYIPGVSKEEYLAFINTFEALLDIWLTNHFYPTLLRELAPGLSGSVDVSDLRFAQEGAEGSSVTFYEGELGMPSIMNLDIGINERLEAQGAIGIPTMDIDLPELDSCLTIGHTQIQGLNAPLDAEGTRSNYHADSVVIDFMSFSKEIEAESGSGATE